MARANTIQTNFTSGEISPKMYGRVDVNKYFNGARKLRNMIVLPQGGAYRRPGTIYVNEVKTSSKKTILRKFIFSETQAYVLEFGENYIRFYYNNGVIESSPGIAMEVTTTYGENDLAGLRFAQSADVLYITHGSFQTRTLTRNSHTSWSFALFESIDGPYLSTNPEDFTDTGKPIPIKMTVGLLNDVATATASSAVFTADTVKTVTGAVTSGGLIKLTVASHGYSTGNRITVANVGGTTEANGDWTITVVTSSTFTLDGSVFVHTYTSGGTALLISSFKHVEIRDKNDYNLARVLQQVSTTVALVDMVDYVLHVDQSIKLTFSSGSDSITASSPAFSENDIGKVVRVSAGSWYNITSFTNSTKVGATLVDLITVSSGVTVTISNRFIYAVVTASYAIFASTDVGRKMRFSFDGTWISGKIQNYSSSTIVFLLLDDPVPVDPTGPRVTPITSASEVKFSCGGVASDWRFGAWSTTSGFPAIVTFHQDRLVFGRTTKEPLNLWLSEINDFVGFSPTTKDDGSVLDTHAITITLISGEVNPIYWMKSGPVLLVGTLGEEWQIKPSSITQTLTPTNIIATPQTSNGAASTTEGYRIGSQTLFIQRGGKKLREMDYDFQSDRYVSKDVTIISEHVGRTYGTLLNAAMQTNPHDILWVITITGNLLGVTYERDQEVIAWHPHVLGGSGIVESVECVPASDGSGDQVYLVVKRTISGTKRYIERIDKFQTSTDIADSYLVDCGLYTNLGSSSNIGTVSGLSHLNGQTVGVVVDGVYVGIRTPSSGSIWVGYRGQKISVGLVTEAVIGILDPEGGSQSGTSQGKKKRISESNARIENTYPYFKTASAEILTNATENLRAHQDPVTGDRKNITPPPTLITAADQGSPPMIYPNPVATYPTLVTGDLEFAVDDAFDTGGRFEFVQDEPYQFNIVGVMHKLNTNE